MGAAVWYTMPIMRNWDETPPRLAECAACTGCTACVAVCPQFARSLPKLKLAAARLGLKKSCAERKEPETFM